MRYFLLLANLLIGLLYFFFWAINVNFMLTVPGMKNEKISLFVSKYVSHDENPFQLKYHLNTDNGKAYISLQYF